MLALGRNTEVSSDMVGLHGDVCMIEADGDAASSEVQQLIEGYVQQAEQLRYSTHPFAHSLTLVFMQLLIHSVVQVNLEISWRELLWLTLNFRNLLNQLFALKTRD